MDAFLELLLIPQASLDMMAGLADSQIPSIAQGGYDRSPTGIRKVPALLQRRGAPDNPTLLYTEVVSPQPSRPQLRRYWARNSQPRLLLLVLCCQLLKADNLTLQCCSVTAYHHLLGTPLPPNSPRFLKSAPTRNITEVDEYLCVSLHTWARAVLMELLLQCDHRQRAEEQCVVHITFLASLIIALDKGMDGEMHISRMIWFSKRR
ncbi:hypothetical protein QBC45DRAFT_123135 [Copromyces sp. CBS 386.78]|nr:hypothetical protein QBC45DRAFT_123135 [Copromyces sp. CBS 386.78]